MYNFNIGKYYNVYSFIHEMHATYKLLCLILFSILILITNSLLFMVIMLLFTLLLMLISNVHFKLYFNTLKSVLVFIIFIFIINTIFMVPITTSIMIILKLLLLTMYSSILMFTTTTYDISKGLDDILSPLKVFKINTTVVSKSISLALSFIPMIFEQGEKILKSQASRGLDFRDSSLKNKVKSIVSIIFPLFMLSFKRADAIADSMEVKLCNLDSEYKVRDNKANMFDILILGTHIFLLFAYLYRSLSL